MVQRLGGCLLVALVAGCGSSAAYLREVGQANALQAYPGTRLPDDRTALVALNFGAVSINGYKVAPDGGGQAWVRVPPGRITVAFRRSEKAWTRTFTIQAAGHVYEFGGDQRPGKEDIYLTTKAPKGYHYHFDGTLHPNGDSH